MRSRIQLFVADNQYHVRRDKFLVMAARSDLATGFRQKRELEKFWKRFAKQHRNPDNPDYMEHQ